MKGYLGKQVILEMYDCDAAILNDKQEIGRLMLEAAELAKATVVQQCFHEYSPHGISGTVVIAESHLNIHTWPEHAFAAVDIFTCGDDLDALAACNHLIDSFSAGSSKLDTIFRGDKARL